MSYREFAKALVKTGPSGKTIGPEMPVLSLLNPSHKFPSDLWFPGQEPFIYFNIRQSLDGTLKPMGNISMYMPSTMKVNYGAGWSEYENVGAKMKALSGMDLLGAAKSLGEGNMSDLYDKTIGGLANANLMQLVKYGASNVADAKLNPAYSQLVRDAMFKERKIVNPFVSQMYEGPVFRQFQLDFGLYARNASESYSISDIIKAFKMAMHPNAVQGTESVFFDFPYVFDIFFITPATDKMFNIKRAVLTDMMVDYAGAGTASFFNSTWAPVDIQMSLTFKEMELLTQNEIDDNY